MSEVAEMGAYLLSGNIKRRHVGRIPRFDSNGNLPPGTYTVSLKEIEERFALTWTRWELFAGLRAALKNLAAAGVKRVWIDGSFITALEAPKDVDGYWEYEPSVNVDVLDEVFRDEYSPPDAMKKKYGVDFFVYGLPLGGRPSHGRTVGKSFHEFLQIDKPARGRNPKGILLVELHKEQFDEQDEER